VARAQWLADREAELLPVPYFPRRFHPAAGGCKDRPPEQALVYGLLMRSAAQPLNLLATERLKARLGQAAAMDMVSPTHWLQRKVA